MKAIFLALLILVIATTTTTTTGSSPSTPFTLPTPTKYTYGSQAAAYNVVVADYDEDDDMDIMVGSEAGGSVLTLYLNTDASTGAWAVGSAPSAGIVYGLAGADVDGDDHADVCFGEFFPPAPGSSTVSCAYGIGDGTFTSKIPVGNTGDLVLATTVADVSGDGRMDIIYGERDGPVFIRLGLATPRTFGTASSSPLPGSADFLDTRVGDFTEDGLLDVVVPLFSSGSIGLITQLSPGVFSDCNVVNNDLASFVRSSLVVDLDRDGHLDSVVVTDSSSSAPIHFLLGDGTGSFSLQPTINSPLSLTKAELSDLNGDNLPDLVLGSRHSSVGGHYYLLGTGTRAIVSTTAAFRVPGSDPARHVGVTDVSGDGVLDIVGPRTTYGGIQTAFGSRLGTYEDLDGLGRALGSLSQDAGHFARVADVSADFSLDVLTFAPDTGVVSVIDDLQTPGSPQVVLSLGSHGFVTAALVDLNADAALDIVYTTHTGRIMLAAATGPSTFANTPTQYADVTSIVGAPLIHLVATRMNADSIPDLVVASSSAITLFLSSSTVPGTAGSEVVVASLGVLSGPIRDVHATDVDGDGSYDLVVAVDLSSGGAALFWGDVTTGTLDSTPTLVSYPDASFVRVSDMDADGRADLVVASASMGSIDIIRGLALARTFDAPSPTPVLAPGGHGVLLSVVVTNFDGRNGLDVMWSGSTGGGVHLNDGTGSLVEAGHTSALSLALHNSILLAANLLDDGYMAVLAVNNGTDAAVVYPYRHTFGCNRPTGVAEVVPSWDLDVLYPECGGAVTTLACLHAVVAHTSSIFRSRIALSPGGTYTTCATLMSPTLTEMTIELVGPATFDCGDAGGVLMQVSGPVSELVLEDLEVYSTTSVTVGLDHVPGVLASDGARIRMTRVHVWDATTGNGESSLASVRNGGFLFASLAEVTLVNCTFTRCSSPSRGGAVYGVSSDVSISGTEFTHCSAGSHGGAVALSTFDSTVNVWTSVFVGNTAGANGGAGCGGALAITMSSPPTAVSLEDVVMRGNTASAAGGALAVESPGAFSAPVRVWGSSVFGANSASFGGTLAAMDQFGTVPLVHPAQQAVTGVIMPVTSLGRGNRAQIRLGMGTEIESSSATWGGLFFECLSHVNATAGVLTGSSSASRGGGGVFVCAVEPEMAPDVGDPASVIGLGPGGSMSAGGYGPVVSSPPVVLDSTGDVPFSTILPSGALLEGSFVAHDGFGQVVRDETAAFDGFVVGRGPSEVEMLVPSSMLSFDAALGGYVFAATRLYVVAWPELVGIEVEVTFSEVLGLSTPDLPGVTLTDCPLGWGRDSDLSDPLLCAECKPGLFSNTSSTAPCFINPECPAPGILQNGVCLTCPANTQRVVNASAAIPPCTCVAGTYQPEGKSDAACLSCPVGASCAGGLSFPSSLPEWFRKGNAFEFVECPIEGACVGGSQCGREYAGFVCKDCADETYRRPDGTCSTCPGASAALFVVLFVLIAVVAVVAFVVVVSTASSMQADDMRVATRTKMIPHALSVALLYAQILGLLAQAPLNWPQPPVQQILDAANVANVHLSFFATDCTLTSFLARYLLSLMIPLVLSLITALLVVVLKVVPGLFCCFSNRVLDGVSVGAVFERLLFTFGPLLYIPLSRATLVFFDCSRLPDGKFYLDAELSQECFVGEWLGVLPLALVALGVYVIFMPAYFAVKLYGARRKLGETRTLLRLGPIYNIYLRRFYFYEVLLLLKRLGIVSTALFFSNVQVWLFLGLMAVFGTALVFQLKYEPFYAPVHNALETRLNVAVSVVVVGGMLFWADEFPNRFSFWVLVCIVLAALAGSIVALAHATFHELRLWSKRNQSVSPSGESGLSPHDAALLQVLDRHADDLGSEFVAVVASRARAQQNVGEGGWKDDDRRSSSGGGGGGSTVEVEMLDYTSSGASGGGDSETSDGDSDDRRERNGGRGRGKGGEGRREKGGRGKMDVSVDVSDMEARPVGRTSGRTRRQSSALQRTGTGRT